MLFSEATAPATRPWVVGSAALATRLWIEAEIVKPSRTAQWPCPFWARPRLFAENWPNKRGAACPNRSAEEDWIEAERRLRANSRQGKTADVSWGDDRVKSAVTRKFPQV